MVLGSFYVSLPRLKDSAALAGYQLAKYWTPHMSKSPQVLIAASPVSLIYCTYIFHDITL